MHGQSHAIGRRHTDQRRTPHQHVADGDGRILDRLQAYRLEHMGKLGLVDDVDRPSVPAGQMVR